MVKILCNSFFLLSFNINYTFIIALPDFPQSETEEEEEEKKEEGKGEKKDEDTASNVTKELGNVKI